MLNKKVFQDTQKFKKKILVVTKYWNTEDTLKILKEVEEWYSDILYGIWENRIKSIKEKNIPREKVHFIWKIQSRKISEIISYCSVIHSLENLQHAEKIEKQEIETLAFLQIRLDEKKEIGILPEKLPEFLSYCKNFRYLKIIGISGMWAWEFTTEEKQSEFQKLIKLRNTYLPHGKISAGTSRDYKIALDQWIDIVRVGKNILL